MATSVLKDIRKLGLAAEVIQSENKIWAIGSDDFVHRPHYARTYIFNTQEDLNLYLLSGVYKETTWRKFEVKDASNL